MFGERLGTGRPETLGERRNGLTDWTVIPNGRVLVPDEPNSLIARPAGWLFE